MLVALGLRRDGAKSLVEHKKCEARKTTLEISLERPGSRLSDAH